MYDMSEEYIWCTLQAMLDLIGLECLGLQCTTSPSTHGTSNHSFLAPSTSQLSRFSCQHSFSNSHSQQRLANHHPVHPIPLVLHNIQQIRANRSYPPTCRLHIKHIPPRHIPLLLIILKAQPINLSALLIPPQRPHFRSIERRRLRIPRQHRLTNRYLLQHLCCSWVGGRSCSSSSAPRSIRFRRNRNQRGSISLVHRSRARTLVWFRIRDFIPPRFPLPRDGNNMALNPLGPVLARA